MKKIEIWEPRYRDKKALIGDWHVSNKMEHYKIVFTGGKRADGSLRYPNPFYIDRKTIRKYPKKQNGGGQVRIVPMGELKDLVLNDKCEHI